MTNDYFEGIDVSVWQGEMNWQKAVDAGAEFAFIRAGSINNDTGACYTDYQFERNSANAPSLLPVGYYWFIRLNHNVVIQAEYFWNLVKNRQRQLPLVVDCEVDGSADVLHTFCNRLYELSGEYCLIYTSPNVWNNKLTGGKDWASDHRLWIANWDVAVPTVPYPWLEWDYWQYDVLADGNTYGAQSKSLDHNYAVSLDVVEPPPPPPSDLEQRVEELEEQVVALITVYGMLQDKTNSNTGDIALINGKLGGIKEIL